MLVGSVPLLPFVLGTPRDGPARFATSAAATAIAFFVVGVAKGWVVHHSLVRSGLETLTIGGVAAVLAYTVGVLLAGIGAA